MLKQIVAVIPARYQSTRFPGKPLAMIGNKAMIERVYEQALKVEFFTKVVVATDDARIFDFCTAKNIHVQLTSVSHLNGTTRCLEVAEYLALALDDIVVNVQGDEPFVSPEQIKLLLSCFDTSDTQIASLCKIINEDIENANTVKVVRNNKSEALYFSRSVIPYKREPDFNAAYYKHIGLYAYRFDVLKEIVCLPESELEKSEKLEQLRWLENGFKIKLKETKEETLSVDTPEDLLHAILFAERFDKQ